MLPFPGMDVFPNYGWSIFFFEKIIRECVHFSSQPCWLERRVVMVNDEKSIISLLSIVDLRHLEIS